MQIKLDGAIYELLGDLFMVDDNFTIGQKLTQIEKTSKKRFYDMTDPELYNALKETNRQDYFKDEYYTEEELENI